MTIGDMKQGLTGSRPALSIVPRTMLLYVTRGLEYGADKYARGNYHGEPPKGVTEEQRLLGYVDAALRHLTRVSDALNRAIGTGGDLTAAASVVDDDGGGKFPPSMLPDLAHALASIAIGVTCAADAGLMPRDPGQPWKVHPLYAEVLARRSGEAGLPQKDDPDAERARVQALTDQRRALEDLNDRRYGPASSFSITSARAGHEVHYKAKTPNDQATETGEFKR